MSPRFSPEALRAEAAMFEREAAASSLTPSIAKNRLMLAAALRALAYVTDEREAAGKRGFAGIALDADAILAVAYPTAPKDEAQPMRCSACGEVPGLNAQPCYLHTETPPVEKRRHAYSAAPRWCHDQRDAYACTEAEGHPGDHVASNGVYEVSRWPRSARGVTLSRETGEKIRSGFAAMSLFMMAHQFGEADRAFAAHVNDAAAALRADLARGEG